MVLSIYFRYLVSWVTYITSAWYYGAFSHEKIYSNSTTIFSSSIVDPTKSQNRKWFTLITDACDSAESGNVNEICILAPCDARHSLSYYIHYKLIGIPLDMFWLHDELCQTKSQLRSERRQFIIRSIIRSKNRVSGGFVLQQTGVHILLTLH